MLAKTILEHFLSIKVLKENNITNFLKGKDIYIVSDLHMGNKSPTDNFYSVEQRFIDFLTYFEKLDNSVLIINGDTFEFWQSSMSEVFQANYLLIDRIIKDKTLFIAGNHDYELLPLSETPLLNSQFLSNVFENIILDFSPKKIKIMHGHEFDPFNSAGKSLITGKIITLIFALLEYDYPNSGIEGRFQRYVEPIVRKIIFFVTSLYKFIFINHFNKYTSEGLQGVLETYHQNHPNEILVCGHTHVAGWWKDYYVNSGAWVESVDPHYIKIDRTGRISLYTWPEQEIVTEQKLQLIKAT